MALSRTHLTMTVMVPLEPTLVAEALKHVKWRQALQLQFQAFLDTHTWTLVPSHPSHNFLGCKWIF